MSDTVFLRAMEFEGRHGVSDEERADTQVLELDIDYELDLRPAGTSDDLARTVSYSDVFEICRAQVEEHSYRLLEALGEAIARDVLASDARIEKVTVTVRKPGVPIDGVLDHAGVRLERSRS
jgi:7,8-dihydroneopterin aldolase/epimerase/oxygenase